MVDPNIMDHALLFTRYKTIMELKPDILFDAAYGVTDDAGAPCLDSGLVTKWTARIGGVTLTQAVEANKPRWLECGIANQPALLFDATDWLSATAVLLNGQVGTIVAVTQLTVVGTHAIVFSGYNAAETDRTFGVGYYQGKTYCRYSVDGPVIHSATGDQVLGTDKAVITWTNNAAGDTWIHYAGATQQTLSPGGVGNDGSWFGDIVGLNRFSVGGFRDAGAYGFPGRIALIAGWNTRL